MSFFPDHQVSGQLGINTGDGSQNEENRPLTLTWASPAPNEAKLTPQVDPPMLSQELRDSSSLFAISMNQHRISETQVSATNPTSIEPAGPQLPQMQVPVEDRMEKFDFESTTGWLEDDNYMSNFITSDEDDV